MLALRDWLAFWIRIEGGSPTFGGFMGGVMFGLVPGAAVALLTGVSMMFVWVSLASGVVGAFLLRPPRDA
jgi:hypothetical protein